MPAKTHTIAVRIVTDAEADDMELQAHVCDLVYPMSAMVPHRRIVDGLWRAASRSRTVLLDADGNPAKPAELTGDDYDKMEYWTRDYIRPRRPGVIRRNNPASLERRRYLMTLCRIIWPRETASHRMSLVALGVEFTDREPIEDWE